MNLLMLGTSVYRAAGEAFYLEGHPNFGEIVGSLPGSIPRVLMFDYKVRSWLYEVAMLTNFTVSGRRIQEMRKIAEVFEIACLSSKILNLKSRCL